MFDPVGFLLMLAGLGLALVAVGAAVLIGWALWVKWESNA